MFTLDTFMEGRGTALSPFSLSFNAPGVRGHPSSTLGQSYKHPQKTNYPVTLKFSTPFVWAWAAFTIPGSDLRTLTRAVFVWVQGDNG